MPQRHILRLGTTAAMSAGALTLLLLTAPPAGADECPPGTDPESTLKNWQCQWDRLINKPSPTPPPKTPAKPPAKKPTKKPVAKKPVAKEPVRKSPKRPYTAPTGDGAVGTRTPIAAYSRGVKLTPYTPGAGTDLPGVLPQPNVAAAPLPNGSPGDASAVLHTRLVAPIAAAEQRQNDQMLWVAAASGLAGAVGALNISVAGRRLRDTRG